MMQYRLYRFEWTLFFTKETIPQLTAINSKIKDKLPSLSTKQLLTAIAIPQQPLILQLSNMPDAKTFITNLFTSKTLTCRKVIIIHFLYIFVTKLTRHSAFCLVMCMNHCPTTILGAIKVSKYLSNM